MAGNRCFRRDVNPCANEGRKMKLRWGAGDEKRSIIWAVALSAMFLLLLWSGCGGKEAPAPREEVMVGEEVTPASEESPLQSMEEGEEPGEAEPVSPGEESVTYKTGEGEVTYRVNQEAPPEEMLGVPVYPGAAYVPGSGGSIEGEAPEGRFTTVGGEFHSPDGFDAVFRWYRDRLGDPAIYDSQQSLATWNRMEGDRMVVVGIRREGGETVILIYSMRGSGDLLSTDS